MAGELLSKRLLIVSGKGGTGKSTVTASLALLAKGVGKRVLVVEVDTVPTVARLLGGDAVTGYDPIEITPGISVMSINGAEALEDYLRLMLKSRRLVKRIVESRIYRYFVAAAPGLKELMCIGKLWDLEKERDGTGHPLYDIILVDMPATGHSFSHLRMPRTAVDTLKIGFAKEEAAKILRLLEDPEKTSFLIVTLAEEMPVNETIELRRMVTETLHFHVGCIFVNGIYPDLFQEKEMEHWEILPASVAGEQGEVVLGPLVASAVSTGKRRAMNRHYVALMASNLEEPLVEIPFIFARDFDVEAIETITRILGERICGSRGGAAQ